MTVTTLLATAIALSLHCADRGGWTFAEKTVQVAEGVQEYELRMTSDKPARPPMFDLTFALPQVDIVQKWQASGSRAPMPPDWSSACKGVSTLSSGIPVYAFVNGADENRLTLAVSEAKRKVAVNMGNREEGCLATVGIYCFTEPEAPISDYSMKVRIDTRNVFWSQAIVDGAAWCTSVQAEPPAAVPPAAREPVYSSWYGTEGSSYWDYGYGHFLDLTTAIIGATGGLVDFSRMPRARRAFLYGAETRLDEENCPPFSDGGGRVGVKTLEKGVRFFPDLKPSVNGKLPPRTYFPDAQVYIGREPDFVFAVKGGNNNEFHNHNDVGSWSLLVKGVEMAGEGGSERYGRDTFTKNRYKLPMLNSYGHPVPVVGGELQPTGGKWRAKVLSSSFSDDRDRLVLDLSGAYSALTGAKGGSLVRTVDFVRGDRPSVSISDAADFGRPLAFESVFLTCGDIECLPDGKSVRITRSGVTVTGCLEIQGGGAWHFEEKPVPNNEDRPLKRLAVVFDQPVYRTTVTWRFGD